MRYVDIACYIIIIPTCAVYTYPITINSPPSGTGNYQQLITLSNPSQYGINSKSSNFYIADSNGSLLYTWIQSYNSTSLTMWVKMPYGTGQVELQVLSSFENMLSSNGYIGLADSPTDNGAYVFPAYWSGYTPISDFYNESGIKLTEYNYNGTRVVGLFGYNTTNAPVLEFNKDIPAGSYIVYSKALHLANLTGRLGASNGFVGLYGTDGTGVDAEMGLGSSFISLAYLNSTASMVDINQQGKAVSEWVNATLTYNATQYFSSTFQAGSTSYTSSADANTIPIDTSNMQIGVGLDQTTGDYEFQSIYQYEFAISYVASMPTFSIGTGSVFQANATTTSTFSGSPGQDYNSTYQYFTYDIPLAPGTNYATVIYNASWEIYELLVCAISRWNAR